MQSSPRISLFQRLSLAWTRSRSVAPARPSSAGARTVRRILLLAVVLTLAVLARPLTRHARAAAFLLRLSGSATPFERAVVVSDRIVVDDAGTTFAARTYVPKLSALDGRPRAVVLAHGVHYLGIDEPRLVALAESFARAGVLVVTPELDALADYHVDDPRNLDVLRASVRWTARRSDIAPGGVGLVGVSFAGGLSLRVAEEDVVQKDLAFVVSIGGHDDLQRVARYFATDVADTPDGPKTSRAHDYGVAVLIYDSPEKFVQNDEIEPFRAALRDYLHESYALAQADAQKLSPEARALFDRVAHRDTHALSPLVLAALPSLQEKMKEASPAGRLASIHVPVYLLHGAHDNVVPPSESEWAAKELGESTAASGDVHLLVTAEIGHAELGEGGNWERARLVHFMAAMLAD